MLEEKARQNISFFVVEKKSDKNEIVREILVRKPMHDIFFYRQEIYTWISYLKSKFTPKNDYQSLQETRGLFCFDGKETWNLVSPILITK